MSSSPSAQVVLRRLPDAYVIARMDPESTIPSALFEAASGDCFITVTRTSDEVSIVCTADVAPEGAEIDGPWAAWYAAGPMPFGLTGVIASLVSPLSGQGLPVFVSSTFNGDVLMVPFAVAGQANELLEAAGHSVLDEGAR